jgi:hypothetical protein
MLQAESAEIGTRHAMVRTVFATEPFLAYVFPSFLSVPGHHALLPDLRLVFDACEMDRDLATFENEGIVYTNVSLVCCNCRLEENGVASFDEAICRLQSQLSERIKISTKLLPQSGMTSDDEVETDHLSI